MQRSPTVPRGSRDAKMLAAAEASGRTSRPTPPVVFVDQRPVRNELAFAQWRRLVASAPLAESDWHHLLNYVFVHVDGDAVIMAADVSPRKLRAINLEFPQLAALLDEVAEVAQLGSGASNQDIVRVE